jgi:hypothetical protein
MFELHMARHFTVAQVTRPNFNRLIVHEEHACVVRLCDATTGCHVQTLSPDTLTAVPSMTQHDGQGSSFVTVSTVTL